MSLQHPCARYDVRWNSEGLSEEDIIKVLRRVVKHFIFQEERGDSGYLHYQGRISLIKKRRKNEFMTLWKSLETAVPFPNYCEPTSNPVYVTGDFSYAMKEDTRIRGPWDDRVTEKYIPRQYRNMLSRLYPFQQRIFDSAKEFDSRIINLIYCQQGNQGKTTVAALCELYGNGVDLPPVNDAEKLIQSLCDICIARDCRDPSPVFVDLPRAMDKSRLNGIYTAIEQIKKGKLYDLRYHYKEFWIDSPQIWVFSNIEPDLDMLSRDRWCIWTINENKELVLYDDRDDLDKFDLKTI